MAAATQVLLSPELAELIGSYQPGVYADMKPFRSKLCPIYASFFDAQFIRPRMQITDEYLAPWLAQYGHERVPKMLAFCKKFRQVLVQYAAYMGRIDLMEYLHRKINLMTCTDDLVDLAALNGQVNMVIYLKHLGYRDGTPRSLVWAAEYGHFDMVKFLVANNATWRQENSWTAAIKAATKGGHQAIVHTLRRPTGIFVVHHTSPIVATCTRTFRRQLK